MSLWDLIKDRFKSLTSTEFLLVAATLLVIFELAMAEKLTVQAVSAIAPVITYVIGRTSQKKNK